ncbi:TPR and ankyrin repeat-containing protein 1-like [Physella acuta]|uniref:TPR and ankyrin repeat-containing protein 1-like n=1 Tax=Physella acuta TaxID=109671 RepID=UPI0027DB6AFD|nr:TPR and ankyrin repeat-containing protein 1-like [Physella acuta]
MTLEEERLIKQWRAGMNVASIFLHSNGSAGHLRVARAYAQRGSLQKAVLALENGYRVLTSHDDDTIRRQILHELVETGQHVENQISEDLIKSVPASLWSQVIYLYIDSKFQDWRVAEFIVNKAWKIETCSASDIQPLKFDVDLGQFCKYDQLSTKTQWVCRLLLWYLQSGCDHLQLKFHPGDTYFHATVTIVVLTAETLTMEVMSLLQHVVENIVLVNKEENIVDDKGNTVLHHLATLDRHPSAENVLIHLLDKGFDIEKKNNEMKTALQIATEPDFSKILLRENAKRLITMINSNYNLNQQETDTKDNSKFNDLINIISSASPQATLPELLCLNDQAYLKLLTWLATSKSWTMVLTLFKERIKMGNAEKFGYLAKGISILNPIKEAKQVCPESIKIDLVKHLAAVKAVLIEPSMLLACLENKEWQLANTLLDLGADPRKLSLTDGDTPNHAALNIGLYKTQGDFSILKTLRRLYQENKNLNKVLNLSKVDKAGNTVFHLASKAHRNKHSLSAVKLLCEWKVKYNVKDATGKLPGFYLTEKDKRYTCLKSLPDFVDNKEAQENDKIYSKIEIYRKKAITVLEKMEDFRGFLTPKGSTNEYLENFQDLDKEEEKYTNCNISEEATQEEMPLEGLSAYEDAMIDPIQFDSMEWDVDCTELVWNLLKSTSENQEKRNRVSSDESTSRKTPRINLPQAMKNLIMLKIKDLCIGDWAACKKIDDVPSTLLLYSLPLPMDACILWECIIAFSPRLSHTFTMKNSSSNAPTNGKIFSQHILIRDIVFESSDLPAAIEKVIISHQKSLASKAQKILKTQIYKSRNKSNTDTKHLPLTYTECDLAPEKIDGKKYVNFYLPASSHLKEYTMLKFYPLNSLMAEAIMRNSDSEIDLPFQVTDIEHSIIHLEHNSPILLLGRSGTGKTTCCLYRLWARYLNDRMQSQQLKPKVLPEEYYMESFLPSGGSDQNEFMDEKEDEDVDDYEYLHQVFITKSYVLCAEVKNKFQKLCKSSKVAEKDDEIPHNLQFQNLEDRDYPLFFTSKQLLLILDASVDGQPFFPRDEKLTPMPGWELLEGNLNTMLAKNVLDATRKTNKESTPNNRRAKKIKKSLKECTYDVFSTEIWPKFDKKKTKKFHPSLVWTEIMSFIKGSYESLSSEQGFLSERQYQSVGQKKAPNFTADRSEIYEIFQLYNSYIKNNNMFDEIDVVSNIYHRLKHMQNVPWTFHEIYVDETQDFSQCELALLVTLCHNPNNMFLAGDTAQCIMRGISFRFCDLKSLFYFVDQSRHRKKNKSSQIELEHLTINYRSHAGILSLASSILTLLEELFPETIDCVVKDQGMLDGPKPVLIETCEAAELAELLTGNQRETSHIEFGAHQAIIVMNEQAKNLLPEELKKGIAEKEWRVVTGLLWIFTDKTRMMQAQREKSDIVYLHKDAPKGLQFDKNQHQLLETELKQLYTAVTRARVNVWIFDECAEKRNPMFHFFKTLNLATHELKTQESFIKGIETSNAKDWLIRGNQFMERKIFSEAVKCYRLYMPISLDEKKLPWLIVKLLRLQ